MKQNEALEMWVIYDNPSDYPGRFVARKYLVSPDGHNVTEDLLICINLDGLRDILISLGKVNIGRMDNDDPVIKEVWI